MSTRNDDGREMPMGDTELVPALPGGGKTLLGHPTGLWVIFVL